MYFHGSISAALSRPFHEVTLDLPQGTLPLLLGGVPDFHDGVQLADLGEMLVFLFNI